MTRVSRLEAVEIVAYYVLLRMDKDERYSALIDILSEDEKYEGIEDIWDSCYNPLIIAYQKRKFIGVTNTYLSFLIEKYVGVPCKVVGEEEELHACICCGYRTLEQRGDYDICRMCWWEDDGNTSPDTYSSPNRMTLLQAREDFRTIEEELPSAEKMKYKRE